MTRLSTGLALLPAFGVVALAGAARDLRAQIVTVRGTVVDDSTRRPVAGATVAVQGPPARSTTTDEQGRFTLAVPALDATLEVTRIGRARATVPLNGRAVLEVGLRSLGSSIKLQEVVVVGYGQQRRGDVTGSVVTVAPERLRDVPTTSVDQALQGAAPGVTVTTAAGGAEPDTRILIRGQNSLRANNDPLVVVDGIPYAGSLSEINQSDIASISVLKDASASAIYGSRGANGVLLITTRRGRGRRPQVSYDVYAGTQRIANLPRMFTGPEFAEFKCTRLNDGNACDDAARARLLTVTEREGLTLGRTTDWVGLATRAGAQQQHNVSVSGATEGTQYFVAGARLDVRGVAQNDRFQRNTLRFNLEQRVNARVQVGTSTQLGWTDRGGVPAAFGDDRAGAFYLNPLVPAFDSTGRQVITPWPEDPFYENALQGYLARQRDVARRVFSSNFVQVELPVRGLSFRLNGGFDASGRSEATYYGRDTRRGLNVRGLSETADREGLDWTLENVLRYTRAFGSHALDLTGLFSAQDRRDESRQLTAQDFPGDELTYYQENAARLLVPGNGFTETGLVSQMARVNYTYGDRYLLTLTARRDGASVFGENNKYSVFPSVAAGWNLSNERFWRWPDNTLKLRGSWGRNGNQAISPYQTLTRLGAQPYVSGASVLPGYIPNALGNPDLKWETTTAANLGVDFGLFGGRLTGSLDAYRSRSTDQLLDRLIPSTNGVSRVLFNIGAVQNRGLELQLTSANVRRGRFRWTSDLNLAANRNKILDLYGDGNDDPANGWFIGRPVSTNWGYVHDGVWQAGDAIATSAQPRARPGDVRYRDVDGNGQITPADRTVISDRDPDFTAGLTNTLGVGGVQLSFLLYTVQGVQRANPFLNADATFNEVRRNVPVVPFWTPESPGNFFPANRRDTNVLGAGMYQDASFVRLRDVTLSYALPERLRRRAFGAAGLRVYASGRNLLTWTRWRGLDPELDGQRAIPPERVFVAGLNTAF